MMLTDTRREAVCRRSRKKFLQIMLPLQLLHRHGVGILCEGLDLSVLHADENVRRGARAPLWVTTTTVLRLFLHKSYSRARMALPVW